MDDVSVSESVRTPAWAGRLQTVCLCALALVSVGCYAPIHSPGIEARALPELYRWPLRTSASPLNYSHLVRPTPEAYLLGSGDKLTLIAPDLIAQGNSEPLAIEVLDDGDIYVPRLGRVSVDGLSVAEAQARINEALSNGLLQDPQVTLRLTEKGVVNVLVLGAVQNPGVHPLPRFQNDVAHALAASQGFSEEAGGVIEIHRRITEAFCDCEADDIAEPSGPVPPAVPRTTTSAVTPGHQFHQLSTIETASHVVPASAPLPAADWNGNSEFQNSMPLVGPSARPADMYRLPAPQTASGSEILSSVDGGRAVDSVFDRSLPARTVSANVNESCGAECITVAESPIVRIPLRGDNAVINPDDVILNHGDVIVIPRKKDQVFYVVGPLSQQNRLRFSLGDRDRQIGNGLLLPDDREIDVVTAVAMAGYIDPVESPTTVTVHRTRPGMRPLLIRVDLIAARSDARETVMVQPGDIIYLNPDPWWYGRRTMDRVIERALGTAIGRWLTN